MSCPAVSPFTSNRPVPPPVPPRMVVPPPVVASRCVAPPPLPEEVSNDTSRLLSFVAYSLLAVILILAGATAKALSENAHGIAGANSMGVVAENTTRWPTSDLPTTNNLTLVVQREADVDSVIAPDSWPADAAMNTLPRSSDEELGAMPLADAREAVAVVDVQNIARPLAHPRPIDEASTARVAMASETVANSSIECSDSTLPVPSYQMIAAGKDITAKDLSAKECADGTCSTPRTLGTLIDWAPTAEQAGEVANEEDKLVFLMQVSGNFAREEFT